MVSVGLGVQVYFLVSSLHSQTQALWGTNSKLTMCHKTSKKYHWGGDRYTDIILISDDSRVCTYIKAHKIAHFKSMEFLLYDYTSKV